MKADLAVYISMHGAPGQYKSVALMLGYKLEFSCCAIRDGFRRDSHNYCMLIHQIKITAKLLEYMYIITYLSLSTVAS